MPNPRSFSLRVQLVETTDEKEPADVVVPVERESSGRLRTARPRSPEFRSLQEWNRQAQLARKRSA
jgi:hypothetical protein